MKADSRLYHNPHCSKSRETLGLLRKHGIEPRIVAYLENPPTARELRSLVEMLDIPARGLLREGEPEFAELGLSDPGKSDDELIAAIHAHPRLLQRPIFVYLGRAVIGRPPEQVLALIEAP